MLNLSKVEKSKVEEAMQECVSRLKEIEAEASQLVTDPEGGDYFLIEAREQEGEQERQALMAKITDTLGPKRSQVVNVLLKECDIFNKFLANDHTVSITEKQSAEGEPRYYFETGTISDGKLILHRTTLIQRDKFNERWGHLFQ